MSEQTSLVMQSEPETIGRPMTMLETVMRAIATPGMTPEVARQYLELGRELRKDMAIEAFNAAFSQLKPELPVIEKNGVVLNRSGAIQFKYAKYDDLHEGITPLLTRHGFATSYKCEEPGQGRLKVILELSHDAGHSKYYEWTLPAMGDNKYVTNLQNAASARSFGKRCVLIDALDILTKDTDSDGRPVAAAQVITEQQARSIEDIIATCTQKDPKFQGAFLKWLKLEHKADGPRQLFQGDQFEAVMDKLRDKMAELGL